MAKELKPGDKAPAFTLETVVLFFYPKDLTPGCTQEACDFRDSLARLKKKGAVVVGVSKDSVEKHRKFIAKHDLTFPLLADVEGKVCEAYGVWKEKALYGRKYMGIERTTFIISPEGRVQCIFAKVKVKGHVDEVLKAHDANCKLPA
jgi:peroxiredoxin Q/BCP